MIYRRLGDSELNVSVIGLGTWGIGGKPFWQTEGDQTSRAAIRKSIDMGVNLIDTAAVYGFGHAESIIGEVVQPIRDEVIIATKCGLRWRQQTAGAIYKDCSANSISEEIDLSLKRLRTDRIDLYQVHWPDPDTPQRETMEALTQLQRQGKIRYIGVSNYSVSQIEECRQSAAIVSVQNQYNLLNREIERDVIPYCVEAGIGILAYSALASGVLTGKYDAKTVFRDWRSRNILGDFRGDVYQQHIQKVAKLKEIASRLSRPCAGIAVNWLIHRAGVTSALVGVKNPGQSAAAAQSASWSLEPEISKSIDALFFTDSPL